MESDRIIRAGLVICVSLTLAFSGLMAAPAPAAYAAGSSGNALNFDGVDDYVLTANTVSGLPTFTVEAWVYRTGGAFGIYETIVEFGNDTPYLGLASGQPTFHLGCTAATAIQNNRWYHLAWVKYSDTSVAVYVDGVEACATSSATAAFTGANMGIGRNSGDVPWPGQIDEVRVWATARTEAEIRANMYREVGATAGLQAVYHFNESGTTTTALDSSGNGYHGTLTNFTMTPSPWIPSGAFGGLRNALEFDGVDDYVLTANTVAGLPTFTVEAWVYRTGGAFGSYETIVEFGNDAPYLGLTDGQPTFHMGCTAATVIQNNRWYHLAWVKYSDTSVAVYVDGVEACATASASSDFTGVTMGIGYNDGDPAWPGLIDEVRVWTTARSAAEIRANMYREVGATAGLQAVYHFNESGAATTALDSSGNGYHGTLINFTGTPWRTSGASAGPRNALDFDGTNDYVVTNSGISAYTAFTVEAWVYYSGASFDVWDGIVVFDGNAPWLGLDAGKPTFWLACTATELLPMNSWAHLAWVKTAANEYAVYVNGLLACSAINPSPGPALTGATMYIGSQSGGSYFWNGKIDEVRVWNVGRTATQIREDMAHTLVGNEAGLQAYYRFDQANAADQITLYDVTANNRHGALTNMEATTDWVASSAYNTWIGAASTDWAAAANWSRDAVPGATDTVGVYGYTDGNAPTSSAAIALRHLLIGTDGDLTLEDDLTLTGNLINHNALSQNAGALIFGGSGRQDLLAEGAMYLNDLTINPGVTLIEGFSDDNVLLNGVLTNHGLLRKRQAVDNIGLQVFGLTGVEIDVQTRGTLADLQVDRIDQAHPQKNANGGGAYIMDHYYTITPSGANYSTGLCAEYTDTELGALIENNLRLCRWTGTVWSCPDRGVGTDADLNIVCADDVTAFSDWVMGAVGPNAVTVKALAAAPHTALSVLAVLEGTLVVLGAVGIGVTLLRRKRPR